MKTLASTRRWVRIGLAVGLMLGLFAAAAHALFDLELATRAGWLPGCLFRTVTGLACPGCGMTRAMLLLAELRFGEAIVMHPAAPFVVLGAAWGAMGWPMPPSAWRTAGTWAAVVALLGLWVARVSLALAEG